MKQQLKLAGLILLILTIHSKGFAKVLLPQILSSNMVLQRDKPITIWGFGAPGEAVTVKFAGQLKKTITNNNGYWEVFLLPLKTSAVPQSMSIAGSNQIVLTNILVGEVWLCSGQSNMEYAMRKLAKIPKPLNEKLGFPQNEVEKAKNPQIRIFLVNRKTLSKPDSIHQSWSMAQDSALRAFSAVGYFFAKSLQEKLGVPIGIVESAVSGSAIEPWIARQALMANEYFKDKTIGNDPGKFYTTMIEPLSKFKLRGFLWYQGETNCFLNENVSYVHKMEALIKLWRTAWNDDRAPFYYVQIAPYNYSKHAAKIPLDENTEPQFWESQAELMKLPNTGMIVTTDLNDNGEDLHPTYKWEVGRRLSLWALAKTYGQPIVYSGPIYRSVQFAGPTAKLTFHHVGNGLQAIDGKPLSGFEIAGADGRFHAATAMIKGDTVVVGSKEVTSATSVRFSWSETGKANLYNLEGLPAMPFRTNNPFNTK